MTIKETIRTLTEAGKSQKEIAQLTGTSRGTVYRCQKQLGLTLHRHGIRCPEITPSQEKQIIGLLSAGLGTGKIAARLGLRQHGVRRIAEKHKFGRKPSECDALAPVTREKILEEITQQRNFAVDLAEKYSVSYKTVLKIAHETLGCPRFSSGRPLCGPFTSNFPQKHNSKRQAAS
jgi:DNA-binding CsgD family transcriptional regulator